MKTAVYYRNDDIRIEERPRPEINDGEILVRMMACGICGTDVMEWYRLQKAPRVLGHEMAGVIAGVGRDVKGLKKGDRVFVSHHVPCFNCHYCNNGNYTACDSLHRGNYDPGGFSEYISVPEENVRYGTFILPDDMTFEDAVMIEPLGCAIAGQKRLGVKAGDTVLIIGSGISGLLHIHLSKLKGARVIATDINDYRLKKAAEFGADYVINAASYSPDELTRINNGHPAEKVIVCTGAARAVQDAFLSVDRRGTLLFFAVPGKDITIPSVRFWREEVSLSFSYGAAPVDLREAVELISSKEVETGRMITHTVALTDIRKGFDLVSEAGDSLKIVVIPD